MKSIDIGKCSNIKELADTERRENMRAGLGIILASVALAIADMLMKSGH